MVFTANLPRQSRTKILARSVRAAVARPTRAARVAEPKVDPVWLFSCACATQLFSAQPSLASGGEFGLLEGRTIALIHPLVMVVLFGTTAYAGWLGWQVRSWPPSLSAGLTSLKSREYMMDSTHHMIRVNIGMHELYMSYT